jgi:hypothetical protein
VIGALFFASFDLRLPRRAGLALAAVMIAVLGYRVTRLDLSWQQIDQEASEFRGALTALEPGVPLLLANDLAGRSPSGYDSRVYWHWGEFAVIDRSAFVPMLFMIRGQQVVHPTEGWRDIAVTAAVQGMPTTTRTLGALADGMAAPADLEHWPYLLRWQCRFRYVAVLHEPQYTDPLPELLEPVRRGSPYTIFRVRRPASCDEGR